MISRKTLIAKTIQQETGSILVSRNQLAKLLGYSDPHNIDKYIKSLTPVVGKKYLIAEVAEELVRRQS